jgi:SAM-dependent methyltransferase
MPDDDQIEDENEDDSLEEDDDTVDPAFYANGGVIFSDDERGALGDLEGKRVLHLTFGCSEEGPSLANMGAVVTEVGDDGTTAALAAAAGTKIEFVDDEPAGLSMDFRKREFDVVYSSFGAIDWIADLEQWAQGISDVLVPGGRLVIYDEHPFSYVFGASETGELVARTSYFGGLGDDTGGEFDDDDEDVSEPGEEGTLEVIKEELPTLPGEHLTDDDEDGLKDLDEAESGWTLGDLVGALGMHGLAILDLQEFETSDRYETPLDRLAGEVDEGDLLKVPSALLVVAIKVA